MRLIDADKLENDIVENITVKAVSRMLAITQGQPTVEAIPVDWIIDWLTKQSIPATSYGIDYSAVEKMLDDWEKENGISQ